MKASWVNESKKGVVFCPEVEIWHPPLFVCVCVMHHPNLQLFFDVTEPAEPTTLSPYILMSFPSEDEVATALFDSSWDVQRAVEMLLEEGNDFGSWEETGKKKKKKQERKVQFSNHLLIGKVTVHIMKKWSRWCSETMSIIWSLKTESFGHGESAWRKK